MAGKRRQQRLDLLEWRTLRRSGRESFEQQRRRSACGGVEICGMVSRCVLFRAATPTRTTRMGGLRFRQRETGRGIGFAGGSDASDSVYEPRRFQRARGAGVHRRRLGADGQETSARFYAEPVFHSAGNDAGTFRRLARSLGKHGGNCQMLQSAHHIGQKLPTALPYSGRSVAGRLFGEAVQRGFAGTHGSALSRRGGACGKNAGISRTFGF